MNEKWRVNYGGGIITRDFGIKVTDQLPDKGLSDSLRFGLVTHGTGTLMDVELFIRSRYYPTSWQIKPFIEAGLGYFYAPSLEAKNHPTRFSKDVPGFLTYNGDYRH